MALFPTQTQEGTNGGMISFGGGVVILDDAHRVIGVVGVAAKA